MLEILGHQRQLILSLLLIKGSNESLGCELFHGCPLKNEPRSFMLEWVVKDFAMELGIQTMIAIGHCWPCSMLEILVHRRQLILSLLLIKGSNESLGCELFHGCPLKNEPRSFMLEWVVKDFAMELGIQTMIAIGHCWPCSMLEILVHRRQLMSSLSTSWWPWRGTGDSP